MPDVNQRGGAPSNWVIMREMAHSRFLLAAALVAGALAGPSTSASAQNKDGAAVAGTYRTKFEQVANSCSGTGMNIASAVVDVSPSKGRNLSVTIPSVPLMRGVASRGGKFRASVKRGKTAIEGVDGRFSVAGRVEKGTIQFLFVAEYFRGTRPLCSQSWNASGPKR
jgi:hypothetical protein